MSKIPRAALRYYGGKWQLAPWIISHFPSHVCYVEPFCGAASVFLRKQPAEFEVLNDIDGDLVNFFLVLREQAEKLIRAIDLTPYSRAEYDLAWQPTYDPLERARHYYVRSWQGWGGSKGAIQTSTSWRFQFTTKRGQSIVDDWNQTEHLYAIAARLKQAQMENDEAIDVIRRYDDKETLFYLDPPYLAQTRSHRWAELAYHHEADLEYHRLLLDTIKHLDGMVIISGYHSTLYDQELSDWTSVEKKAITTNVANRKVEILWLSPNTTAIDRLPLFSLGS